jgi:hypothetical protein
MKCRKIELAEISDQRGQLMFAEEGAHIPFPVKRIFTISDVPAGQKRGGHAHREQHQVLIMLAGGCDVLIDEGSGGRHERLDSPTVGLYVPAQVWVELTQFKPNSICLVLASGQFDEADYIRDYDEFAVTHAEGFLGSRRRAPRA